MALISCDECGANISSAAKTCPQCGREQVGVIASIGRRIGLTIKLGFALLFGVFVYQCTIAATNKRDAAPSPPLTVEQEAQEQRFQLALAGARALKNSMKNPDSFKLESVTFVQTGSRNFICYYYRSTNSFNAVVPGTYVLNAEIRDAQSSAAWNKHCAGKTGDNFTSIRSVI